MTTQCKNCGHESHCGGPLTKSLDPASGKELTLDLQVEVCKRCRCVLCEIKTDFG